MCAGDKDMKGFERKNQRFSLCGLNCGLCPMFLGGNCGGCGSGNQSCGIARCSLEHGKPEYCYECGEYPCQKYEQIDAYDSFITHQRQKSDLEKAQRIGIERYNQEQEEKAEILTFLLSNYNDGRRKSFFCTAVNLLELPDLREALRQIRENRELDLRSLKERSSIVVQILQRIADERGVVLKLKRKK